MWRHSDNEGLLTPMWHPRTSLTPRVAMCHSPGPAPCLGLLCLANGAHQFHHFTRTLFLTSQPRRSPWTTQTSPQTSISVLSLSPSTRRNLELTAAAALISPTMLLINGGKEMLFGNMG